MRNSQEDRYQAELFSRLEEWGNFTPFSDYIRFVFAVPNGGKRSKSEGALLKATGTTSGVHDIVCPWTTYEYNLLTIEMKADNGKPSQNQLDFADFLTKTNSRYIITNSVDEAERAIIRHLIDAVESPEFGIFEAEDTPLYYFTEEHAREIGYEMKKPNLWGDPTISQQHAIKLTRKNWDYPEAALRG